MSKSTRTTISRRRFLQTMGVGGVGVAALAGGLPLTLAQNEIKYLNFLSQELDPPQIAAHRANIRAFEALHPDVRIDLQLTPAEQIVERMVAALSAGVTALDVLQPNPATALGVAARGQLLPIDDLVEEVGGDNYFYGNSVLRLNGSAYGVPFGGGTVMVWYRKDLFDEAGFEAPTSLEEFEEIAAHFTRSLNPDSPTEYGIALPYGKTGATGFNISPFWWAMGGEFFDKDYNIVWASDETAQFLDWYGNMYQYTSEAAIGWSWGELINTFLSGQSAMTLYLGRVLSRTAQNAPQLLDSIGVFNFPKGKVQVTQDDPNYLVINNNTPNPEAAKEWVKFLITGDAANQFLCTVPGHLPPATQAQQAWWDQEATGCDLLDAHTDIKQIIGESVNFAYFPVLNAGGVIEAIRTGSETPVPTGVPNPMYMVPTISLLTMETAIQEVVLNGVSGEDAMMSVLPALEDGVAQFIEEIGWEM